MILLILINLVAFVEGQDIPLPPTYECRSNGNYTRNSAYRANLYTLLDPLHLSVNDYGFCTSSMGQNEDRVNALVLCRADQTVEQCRSCVKNASDALPQQCPHQKEAILISEFCLVRYSNEPVYGSPRPEATFLNTDSLSNKNITEFRAARTRLIDVLRPQASNGGSLLKVGAGTMNASDLGTLYGMMQCTPDLSMEQCDNCLRQATQRMQSCCDTAPGVRSHMPSCYLRFELYPFYNDTRLRELQGLLLLPPPPPGRNDDNTRSGKKDDNKKQVVIILVSVIGVSLILAAGAVKPVIFLRKRIKRGSQEIPEIAGLAIDEISTVKSLQYDFGEIRAATSDFNNANKLGQGGFGAVYRGKLQTGQKIAVKRLSKNSKQGNVEFMNEVLLVAKLQHRNLVRFLGFSLEGTERLLIYEFVQNASLDQFLFDPIKRSHLDWKTRYKIISGVGRGLLYLHEDSRLRIIHRDLKASNVLLDGDMNPKIADFGMARLFRQDETQGSTNKIVGTYGYMSPEYAMHGEFSIKSDVFSFGVLVLEIISSEKNSRIGRGENMETLLTLTWKSWREGTTANMIDPVLRTDTGSLCEMLRCIHIGLLCVQENAADRPTMTSVVLMLSSSTTALLEPSEPAFYMGSRSILQKYDSKAGVFEGSSQNEMSATVLYPR